MLYVKKKCKNCNGCRYFMLEEWVVVKSIISYIYRLLFYFEVYFMIIN